eukprot:gnl/TRDRNA2_/TRDRNA2_178503_c0_seq1.p1 gnl/TRDRNA2_/TRDRNA2_178503_c0~~gnl/TRDRNA2_/TRDRNA2_178503_c0_seq1.p1  ORF type:complete len:240 (+),score=49.47 gnl/TRDRNA2_/TRDRNA2_178503_c0_seq1:87-806(+)
MMSAMTSATLLLLICGCWADVGPGAQKQRVFQNTQQCKTLCQRFAMPTMGEEFKGITMPQECVKKCDEVGQDQPASVVHEESLRGGRASEEDEKSDEPEEEAGEESDEGEAILLQVGSTPKVTNHQCKVTCQRFGMKSLGEAFSDITRPQDCVKKCDEVFKEEAPAEATSLQEKKEQTTPSGSETKAMTFLQIRDTPKMNNHQCKVVCQRFGFHSLGSAFANITHPTACVSKCDEVYPA